MARGQSNESCSTKAMCLQSIHTPANAQTMTKNFLSVAAKHLLFRRTAFQHSATMPRCTMHRLWIYSRDSSVSHGLGIYLQRHCSILALRNQSPGDVRKLHLEMAGMPLALNGSWPVCPRSYLVSGRLLPYSQLQTSHCYSSKLIFAWWLPHTMLWTCKFDSNTTAPFSLPKERYAHRECQIIA